MGYGRSLDLPSLILEPAWLDFSHSYIAAHHRSLTRSKASAQIWISETAAAWASGTAGVCDGFVSGFWWLDQLGAAATDGHSAMCRQCLVGGNYSLIDQLNGFKPNPDYWTAWIHKRLVGQLMLAIEQTMPLMGDYIPHIRAYMSCTSARAPGYQRGSVTLMYVNQGNTTSVSMYQGARFSFVDQMEPSPWGPTPPPFNQLPRTEYILTSYTGDMLSRDVALNGKLLAVQDDGSMPMLRGREASTERMVVPPRSYGFAVYHKALAPACM